MMSRDGEVLAVAALYVFLCSFPVVFKQNVVFNLFFVLNTFRFVTSCLISDSASSKFQQQERLERLNVR